MSANKSAPKNNELLLKKEDGSTQSDRHANVKTESERESRPTNKVKQQSPTRSPQKKPDKPLLLQELTNRFLAFKKKMNEELVDIYKETKIIFQKREQELMNMTQQESKEPNKSTTQGSHKKSKRRSRSRSQSRTPASSRRTKSKRDKHRKASVSSTSEASEGESSESKPKRGKKSQQKTPESGDFDRKPARRGRP